MSVNETVPGARPCVACLRCSEDPVSCRIRPTCAHLTTEERLWKWVRLPDEYCAPVPVVSTDDRYKWAGFCGWDSTDDERRTVVDIDERIKIRSAREWVYCSCGHRYIPDWFGYRCPRCGRPDPEAT